MADVTNEDETSVSTKTKLSVTKLSDFERCPAYYHHKYILKIPQPLTDSLTNGIALHDAAERYLLGKDIEQPHPEGPQSTYGLPLVRAAKRLLPPPGSVEVESWCKLENFGGENTTLVGRVDYHSEAWDSGVSGVLPLIGDHKTHSDFKWAETEETLVRNRQLSVYAEALYPNAPGYIFEHIQYRTKGTPTAQRTRVIVKQSQVKTVVERARQTAASLLQWLNRAARDTLTEQDARTGACGDYGGCPFAAMCKFSPKNRNSMNVPKMSMEVVVNNGVDQPAASRRDRMAALGLEINPPMMASAPPTPVVQPAPVPATAPVGASDALRKTLDNLLDSSGGKVPEAVFRKIILRNGADADTVLRAYTVKSGVVSARTEPEPVATPSTPTLPDGYTMEDWGSAEAPDWRIYTDEGTTIVRGGKSAEQATAMFFAAKPQEAPHAPVVVTKPVEEAPPAPVVVTKPVEPAPPAPVVVTKPVEAPAAEPTKAESEVLIAAQSVLNELNANGGYLSAKDLDERIKKGLGLQRLRATSRAAVVEAARQVSAWFVNDAGDAHLPGHVAPTPTVDTHKTVAVEKSDAVVEKNVEPQKTAAPTPEVIAPKAGPVVYIDAMPLGSESIVKDLSRWLQTIEDKVAVNAQGSNLFDAGMPTSNPYLISYNRGAQLVATQVLLSGGVPAGEWFLSGTHPAAPALIPVLLRMGVTVVRGVR
jgi:hypothetical protein